MQTTHKHSNAYTKHTSRIYIQLTVYSVLVVQVIRESMAHWVTVNSNTYISDTSTVEGQLEGPVCLVSPVGAGWRQPLL